jgi:acetyl-CoA carboxylase biotin carboxyl carrier protein
LNVDLSVLEKLANFLERHDLTDVEIEDNGIKAIIRRQPAPLSTYHQTPLAVATATATAVSSSTSQSSSNSTTITAPLLGTVYARRDPSLPPFVSTGQRVSQGDVLCLIEAMKLFNEVTAPKDGVVLDILYQDGATVEYGAPLFTLG